MADLSLLLPALILLAALLYASVGHGGASGYLAVMALAGIAPAIMKPTALALNILVAGLATWKFARAGSFSWRLFWLLAVLAIPAAWLGGQWVLPTQWYKPLVGVVLIYAALRAFFFSRNVHANDVHAPNIGVLIVVGAVLGLLSGLTGVGGGIFLSPLLLLLRWADTRTTSGVAAAFILVNSASGLLGAYQQGLQVAEDFPLWAAAAVIGGYLGAEFGSKRLANPTLQKLLAAVLIVAGGKMIASML